MINEKEKDGKSRIRKSKSRNKTIIETNFDKTMSLNLQIDLKLEEIEYLKILASKTENVISNVGRTKRSKSKVEECMCKVIEIEESIKKDKNMIMSLNSQSEKIINKINRPELKSLLSNRYIYGKKWDEVSMAIGYSYAHIFRLHSDALAKLREIETGTGADKQ